VAASLRSRTSKTFSPQAMTAINTTPLIDVMLVLLVMLIITIPVQLHSVNLNLPTGKPPPAAAPPEVVQIDIDFDGTLLWNGEVVRDLETLETRMRTKAAQQVQPEVHLRPNRLVHYDRVAAVMAAAKRVGLTRLGIVDNERYLE